MSGDELRDQGIAAAKAGRKDDARKLLAQATQLNPRDTQAWLFLASVTDDKKARLVALRHVLEIDPANPLAVAAVKALGIDPDKLLATSTPESPAAPPPPAPAPTSPPPAPSSGGGIRSLGGMPPPPPKPGTPSDDLDDLLGGDFAALGPKAGPPTQADLDALFGGDSTPAAPSAGSPSGPKKLQSLGDRSTRVLDDLPAPAAEISRARAVIDTSRPGVPTPDPDFVAQAIKDVDYLAQTLLGQMSTISADWVQKTKGRAGESDIWRLRAQIWGAAGAFILTLVIVVALFISTPEGQRIAGRFTRVPSRTPTNTPTFTPGFTPTPTATLDSTRFPTYTPSPTIPLTLSPIGRPNATPRATARYLPVPLDGGLPGAVTMLDRGRILDALPTLDAEFNIAANSAQLNPNAYYWDGIALARAGKFSEALNVLTEGESRLETDTNATNRPQYKALIDLGFAEYEYLRGMDLLGRGEIGNAQAAFEAARSRAQLTLDFEPRYALGYLFIAKSWEAERDPEQALEALDAALLLLDRIPEFGVNVDFVIERGNIYLLRADMRRAAGDQAGERADLQAAQYQGYYAVYLNPFDRRGHELRIQTALDLGVPGDAVLANDTYRLFYPDDPRALRLLGDARIDEGNTDLALGSYAAALDSDLKDADGVAGPDSVDILARRAQVFYDEGEFAAALADLNTALAIPPARQDLQAMRMDAAYAAGDYETALADARALFNSRVAPNDVFKLMEARALVTMSANAEPEERRNALQQADDALDFVAGNLPATLRAVAGEVRATVLLERGFPADAVAAADETLELINSPTVRLIRGQAWEAQNNLVNAARDYQRVLEDTADSDEDLALKAREGLERVAVSSTATSTAVTATAIAGATSTSEARKTATQIARETATANAANTATADAATSEAIDNATATGAAIGTATGEAELDESPTPTYTPTDSDEDDSTATRTPSPTRTLSTTGTPTRTPSPTRTPRPTSTGGAGDGSGDGGEETIPTP